MCAGLCICALEPHIYFSFFYFLLCFTAAAAGSWRLYHTVSQALKLSTTPYVAATVQPQSHGKFVCVHIAYACDVCAMIRKHVAFATTRAAAVMFKVNSSTQQEFLLIAWHYYFR